MTEKYIISHDLGTSENKAVLVTVYGEIVHTESQQYPIHHPEPGFAEQDPFDWWEAVCSTTRNLLKKSAVKPENIAGITFSSQGQTLVPVDSAGNPVVPAISWMDGRGTAILREKVWKPPRFRGYNLFNLSRFLLITGGTPGHSGKDIIGKILWLQKYKPAEFKKIDKFLDAKDFIIYHLTGNFVKSIDMGYVWWLMDTRRNRNVWHPKLLELAGITSDQLPVLKESAAAAGEITPEAAKKTGLLPGTPVMNGAMDLSAAAVGSGALDEGELHINIGTSGWVAGHFTKRKTDVFHYTGCVGSANPSKYYIALAHQITAGTCLEWLRDKMFAGIEQQQEKNKNKNKDKEKENGFAGIHVLDELAQASPAGAANLMFTPWMYGEQCPIDDDNVRGGFFNLGINHKREDLVRAVMEGVAFNTRWALETVENLYSPVDHLNIIGGGAKSDIWCSIMADVTDRTMHQVENPQYAGAIGAALLASMTLGYIESYASIKKYIKIKQAFQPNPKNREIYDHMFKEFKNLYLLNKKWYSRMNRKRNGKPDYE